MSAALLTHQVARAQSAWHKISWGVRTVGPVQTARGGIRLAWLALTKPSRSEIKLRSGAYLAFAYPSQFPPLLVLFGDVIDPEYQFLRHILPADAVVMDVGAAIGQFSVLTALNPCKVVHAFEPSDANIETLEQNLIRNGVKDAVIVHRTALAERVDEVIFPTAERTYMSRLDRHSGTATGGRPVPVRRLDDELDRLGIVHVDVLKVNVAGYEPAVLEGATAALTDGRVDILILLIGTASMPWYQRLHELGYALGFYHPVERSFYRINVVDERLLHHRPWPARHLLAIREPVLRANHAVLEAKEFITH